MGALARAAADGRGHCSPVSGASRRSPSFPMNPTRSRAMTYRNLEPYRQALEAVSGGQRSILATATGSTLGAMRVGLPARVSRLRGDPR